MSEKIYVIEHAASGDILRTYSGMPKDAVAALVSANGNPCDIVDEATYAAKFAAIKQR